MKTDSKIIKYTELRKIRELATKEDKTIVFTSGCYDILHVGHIAHFDFCKSKGDILIVTVGNDKTVSELKGPSRPINKEMFRAQVLAAIEYIDYVVISEEFGKMDHNLSVALLSPDFFVINFDDSAIEAKQQLIDLVGGKLVKRQLVVKDKGEVLSVTEIEKRMKKKS